MEFSLINTLLKTKLKLKPLIAILFCAITLPVGANSIDAGDGYFQQQQYHLATTEYLAAAEIGNPRAYYQLGAIYYQGLGTDIDNFKALVWFSLAAEHYFENSAEIADKLFSGVAEKDKSAVSALVERFKQRYGKQQVNSQYYPELVLENLSNKVTFGEQGSLDDSSLITDSDLNTDMGSFDDSQMDWFLDEGIDEVNLDSSAEQLSHDEFFNRPYFLIADYDVGADGSIRNIQPFKALGNIKGGLHDLSISQLAKPKFNNQNVHFIHRSYLGFANLDRFEIRAQHPTLYSMIKRQASKLSKSDAPNDLYKRALLLMSFSWLKQESGDIERLLKSAAEAGHNLAKYEYGLKLYREQSDLKQAIYWLSEASKQGISDAQYRLARVLLDSPWVVHDEKKALFWLDSAAKKEHIFSLQKAAEIKLLAKDQQLHDIDGAISYLTKIEQQQLDNPQYQYLQAIAHNSMQPRKLSNAVVHIRKAIELGENHGWDVRPWQLQLKKWTSGGTVTIQEL